MSENLNPSQTPNPWYPERVPSTIELADGTIINGSGGLAGDEQSLILWTDEGTFQNILEVITAFTGPEKTAHIILHYSRIEERSFDGFTDLRNAEIKTNGSAEIRLYK